MRRTTLGFVALFGSASVLAIACGASEVETNCIDQCEASKKCPGANPNEDCPPECHLLAEGAEHAGCEAETDAVTNCSRKGCDQDCLAETSAYLQCLQAFCEANPDDENCARSDTPA
jgi:hypothetical protein